MTALSVENLDVKVRAPSLKPRQAYAIYLAHYHSILLSDFYRIPYGTDKYNINGQHIHFGRASFDVISNCEDITRGGNFFFDHAHGG